MSVNIKKVERLRTAIQCIGFLGAEIGIFSDNFVSNHAIDCRINMSSYIHEEGF